MIQQMLAIWSLVPLPFLKPAWTSGSSRFTYCWSLGCRILSITLLACEMCGTWSILWHCLSLGLEWKLTLSSPVATAEFSKFADNGGGFWQNVVHWRREWQTTSVLALKTSWTVWKGKGTRDQIANICGIMEKATVPEKHLLLLYWLCQSLWLCGSQQTGKFF